MNKNILLSFFTNNLWQTKIKIFMIQHSLPQPILLQHFHILPLYHLFVYVFSLSGFIKYFILNIILSSIFFYFRWGFVAGSAETACKFSGNNVEMTYSYG